MEHFEQQLKKHLQKCELKFRADKLPDGSNVEWLAPYCDNVQSIEQFLRSIGFKIHDAKDTEFVNICDFDDEGILNENYTGESVHYVETTGGIAVHVNNGEKQGYVERTKGEKITYTYHFTYD